MSTKNIYQSLAQLTVHEIRYKIDNNAENVPIGKPVKNENVPKWMFCNLKQPCLTVNDELTSLKGD